MIGIIYQFFNRGKELIYDEMEASGHLGKEEGSLKDDEAAPYQTRNIGRQRNLEPEFQVTLKMMNFVVF